jgi:photosystem II stability/assembly factor-like uncharacterized protein
VRPIRPYLPLTLGALLALSACDDDPNEPRLALDITGCLAAGVLLDVNAPVSFSFTQPVAASTVTGGNVVVSDAETGFEIPGALALGPDGTTITFTPSSILPFDQRLRFRFQNLRTEEGTAMANVRVCEATTEPPPIRELVWARLPSAGGTLLNGVSRPALDVGFVISQQVPLYRRQGTGEFRIINAQPYYSAGFDVNFVNATHGFISLDDVRDSPNPALSLSAVLESLDGGVTFDTIGTFGGSSRRLYFKQLDPTDPAQLFGVVVGGPSVNTRFSKFRPETRTFTNTTVAGTRGASDVDFVASDTSFGAVSTFGIRNQSLDRRGQLFRTTDGGNTWELITAASADASTITYRGVAMRTPTEIWVVGGNGFVGRIAGTGPAFTIARLLEGEQGGGLNNPDPNDYEALIYNDIAFAPDDPDVGWIVGAQQVGVVNGVPRYQGVIFRTCDGGTTWTRQGVSGAENYGAEFARLERLSVLSRTHAWAAGEEGTVLEYAGTSPCP